MRPQLAEHRSDFVDLSLLSHPDLDGLGDTVLAQALRELLEPDLDEGEAFARFDNSTAS
ncbi:FXSXX-COOH protein [Nonomuraea sp. NPDC050790]|uniref:FXSXX-COOH protein n=1 Tax=Nonomuraea sp. NPDC050790 TaxID=3364371 RepID=UPI0037926B17